MLKIALTGGIGAGKSTVARKLAQLGAHVIDADVLARDVVAPDTEGLAAVVSRFGPGVLDADGALDRARLADIVFNDAHARAELEAIIHPRVRQRARELTAAQEDDAIVVQDIPLLVETGGTPNFHLAVDVEAPRALRLERLVARGMDRADAVRRVDAQAGDVERSETCDVVLYNDEGLPEIERRVTTLWNERIVPFADNLRFGAKEGRPEQFRFVESDTAWPRRFEHLAARLRRVMGPSAVRIDHVGSTAVAGLLTEDIIDIQVTVVTLNAVDMLESSLGEAGFFGRIAFDEPKPEGSDASEWEKRLYCYADPGNLSHIHFRPIDSPGQRFALLFRDWLRADDRARADYARAKGESAGKADSLMACTDTEEPWLSNEAWPRANEWAEANGWHPPVC